MSGTATVTAVAVAAASDVTQTAPRKTYVVESCPHAGAGLPAGDPRSETRAEPFFELGGASDFFADKAHRVTPRRGDDGARERRERASDPWTIARDDSTTVRWVDIASTAVRLSLKRFARGRG
jgi:hypothetical protein